MYMTILLSGHIHNLYSSENLLYLKFTHESLQERVCIENSDKEADLRTYCLGLGVFTTCHDWRANGERLQLCGAEHHH